MNRKSTILLAAVSFAGAFSMAGDCPPCWKSFTKIKPSSPGALTQVKVCLSSNFGSNQSLMQSGLSSAVSQWNNARQGGLGAPYSFSVATSGCEITVAQAGMPPGVDGVAFANLESGLVGITGGILDSIANASISQSAKIEHTAGMIAHELGHFLGLTNLADDPSCDNIISVMAFIPPPSSPAETVGAFDVGQANKAFSSSQATDCKETYFPGDQALQEDCDLDSCSSPHCPGWTLEQCTNVTTVQTVYNPTFVIEDCYYAYLVTEYYYCEGGSCQYYGSTWDYLGVVCF